MRIVIDLQGAQTECRFRGIGHYSLSLAKAIVRNRGEDEIIIALNGLFTDSIESIRDEFNELLPQENILVWQAPGPVRERRRETAEIIREAFLASLRPDIVHIASLFEGYTDDAVSSIGVFDQRVPVSVSLYDLIPLSNPDRYLADLNYSRYYLKKINYLKRSSLLLAISEYSRQEGIERLARHPESIVNVSVAADANFRPLTLSQSQTEALWDKFGITRPFLFYAGGTGERKNLSRLIQAYSRLPHKMRDTHQLVFAGKIANDTRYRLQRTAESAGLRTGELIFAGYTADDELIKLYNSCKLYIFPAWDEGFSLPALEAMSCGAPAIAANARSLPKIVGCGDALFDPYSAISICNKIEQVLSDEAFRVKLITSGLAQVEKFSWDESAKRALKAMRVFARKPVIRKPSKGSDEIVNKLISSIVKLGAIGDDEMIRMAKSIDLNLMSAAPRRYRQLLVDVSELVRCDAKTGIHRVVRSIMKEWLGGSNEDLRVEPVYATPEQGYRYARHFFSGHINDYGGLSNDNPIEYRPGDIFLGLDLTHIILSMHLDFYQHLRRHGVQVQFMVYDLLPILMPQYFWPGAEKSHATWLETISLFDGVLCISKAVANEFKQWFDRSNIKRLSPFKIGWFHLGADIKNSNPSLGIPKDASRIISIVSSRISFLMVGTIEPRKGHVQVIKAFEKLWEDGADVNLVIVGKKGWMTNELVKKIRRHNKLNMRLFWLKGISDEYLEKVYGASSCLIAASEGEGFGLPLIEAAQYKLPIIARDIPVFREVAGEYAYYFPNSSDPDILASAAQDWLKLYESGKHPKSDDMPWLTWAESARRLLELILPQQGKESKAQSTTTVVDN